MIKLYLSLHNVTPNFIKQFINVSLLLFLILQVGINANAQCVVNPVANQAVCNNTATTAINFTGTATIFNWVNNTTSIGLAASGTGNIPSFTALNATVTAVAATITVTPSAGACTGTPISFTITVNPSPIVSITPTTSCGGVAGLYGVPLVASWAGPPVPNSVTVNSGIINLAVPDNTANGVSNNIILTGVPANATITNVSVTLNMLHTYPGDMIIHLKAPNGQILNLYKYNNGQFTGPVSGNATWGWYGAKVSQTGITAWSTVAVAPFIYNNSTPWKADAINSPVAGSVIQNPTGFVSNATNFASLYTTGASTNGNWTLAMADGGMPGDIGILASWSMTIDYTTPSGPPHIFTWSPSLGLYMDPTTTAPYTGTQTPLVYAAPTTYTVYTVTGTNTATGCIGTATTQVNFAPPAPVVTPNPAIMCLGDPAIKLKVGLPPNTVQFCSGPINIPVPDNNPAGASNSIAVSGIPASGMITAISVTINMPHTRVGNMVFVLKAPNIAVLNLDYHLSATGGAGPTTGFLNTVISSVNSTFLSTGTNPYTGTFRADAQGIPAGGFGASGPTGMLQTISTWAGLAPTSGTANGNWTLGFYDAVTGDVGTLNSWCLNISYTPGPGIQSSPAVWSPASGLFNDPNAVVPYVAGTAVDSVWARPTPAGTYTYAVTTQSLPVPLCTPTTNFVSTNGNATVTFNVKNNHPFPIVLSQIDSKTLTTGTAIVSAYFKPSLISGLPGAITPANGWVQFGASNITGTGTGVQSLLTNLNLIIPAGASYGLCLQVLTASNAPNLAYSALGPGNYSFNDGGCELITGFFSGTNVPAAPTTTQSGFVGAVHFSRGIAACTSPPRYVVVTVGQAITITQQPAAQTVCVGVSASFSVAAAGAGPFTYQWQVSTNGGASYTNLVNGGGNIGVNTNTLLITTTTVGMNGYLFRVAIASGCPGAISTAALLTVNPLPNIVITANPLIIGPTQTTTILSTVTPNPATTYTWYYNNSVLPGATSANLLVNYGSPGDYQLKVTDINNCGEGVSNIITIANSFALNNYTYPNPSAGIFQVRYPSEVNIPSQRTLNVFNNRGDRIITKTFTQTIPYQKVDVDIRAHGKGLYWIELRDAAGKRLAVNRAVVQ